MVLLYCFYLLFHVWFIDFIYRFIYLFIIYLFIYFLFVYFSSFISSSLFHLFFVVIICFLDFPHNFYCHESSIFYLNLSTWIYLPGFVNLNVSLICLLRIALELSVYPIVCKSEVALIKWGFLQWQKIWWRDSYPIVA